MSAMVISLALAAALLSNTMGYLHLPPYALIAMRAAFYVLLGLFLEGISITVMTLPITLPLILQVGFNPLWFGIFLLLCLGIVLLTAFSQIALWLPHQISGR